MTVLKDVAYMSLLDKIHGKHIFQRRVRVLAELFAELLPAMPAPWMWVCGEGWIDSLIMGRRPDVSIRGGDRSDPVVFLLTGEPRFT